MVCGESGCGDGGWEKKEGIVKKKDMEKRVENWKMKGKKEEQKKNRNKSLIDEREEGKEESLTNKQMFDTAETKKKRDRRRHTSVI